MRNEHRTLFYFFGDACNICILQSWKYCQLKKNPKHIYDQNPNQGCIDFNIITDMCSMVFYCVQFVFVKIMDETRKTPSTPTLWAAGLHVSTQPQSGDGTEN